MRTIATRLEALMPPTPYFPRRLRSTTRPRRLRSTTRPRRPCFRMRENDFVREKVVVKGSQRGKGRRKCEGDNGNEEELEGGNVNYVNEEEVDLILVARVGVGAYEKELESMMKGMSTEQLVGFMDSLDGQWCGRSERRKVVDAGQILKLLPINWKIEIAVLRRAELSSLYCRSYVSPTGMRFKSCKDAAVYLIDQSLINVAGPFQVEDMRQIKDGSHMFLKSINEVTSSSILHEANNNLSPGINDLYDVKIASRFDCFPCGLTFDDMGGLKKHLANFHKKTTRIFELPKQPHTLHKAQTDPGQRAVVGHGEPRLGEASSSAQKIAEPVAMININGNGSGSGSARFRTECTWCNKEFLCKQVDAETMAEATCFVCPQCKEKLCGALERGLSWFYQQ
ncbi:hypothetical protein L1987_19910 [Smallanthus sonchifolius]|uniref:Uncharacterized protein n=1 Tax=Smallanthus sonchifolius TaxID=185202 RepID=A0ACB9IRL1_9ASTR|nr:hypothetical protein L1987_19910 [Smallanthus sonchifolius]